MTLPTLRDQIDQYFNDNELRHLCFDLGIEYENLPGDTRKTRAQSLIQHCLRHDKLTDLGNQCRKLRQAVVWPDVEMLAEEWKKVQQTQENLSALFNGEQLEAALAPLHQKEAELLV